jgi:hypothetical protein
MQYLRIYESNTGGYVDLHALHGADELPANSEAAWALADQGHAIQLLPTIVAANLEMRKKELPDIVGNKNPEALYSEEIQGIKKEIIRTLQPDRNKSVQQVWIITQARNIFKVERAMVFNEAIYDAL